MTLHVKNMVCDRCVMVVRQQMENLGFAVGDISLGSVQVSPAPDTNQLAQIASALKVLGFELIDSEKERLAERIKAMVIEKVHHGDMADGRVNFSEYLAAALNKEYGYLSRLFSDAEDTTIEKFIIQQKIEKVKELLEYGELNLNEIAYQMGYSSSAHLSAQFKQITGLTPSAYKAAGLQRRPLDSI